MALSFEQGTDTKLFIIWGCKDAQAEAGKKLKKAGIKPLPSSIPWDSRRQTHRLFSRSRHRFYAFSHELPYWIDSIPCRHLAFMTTVNQVQKSAYRYHQVNHFQSITIFPSPVGAQHYLLRWYDIHRDMLEGLADTDQPVMWIASPIESWLSPALRGNSLVGGQFALPSAPALPALMRLHIGALNTVLRQLVNEQATPSRHRDSVKRIKHLTRQIIMHTTKSYLPSKSNDDVSNDIARVVRKIVTSSC